MGSSMLMANMVETVSKVAMVCIVGMRDTKNLLIKVVKWDATKPVLKFGAGWSIPRIFKTVFYVVLKIIHFAAPPSNISSPASTNLETSIFTL